MQLDNTAEGGTNGVTASTSNTGGASGDVFNATVGTPTITFSNAFAHNGSLSYRVVVSSTQQYVQWNYTNGSTFYGRMYMYMTAYPVGGTTGIVRFLRSGGQAARIAIETTGVLTLRDAGNAAEFSLSTPCALNQWIRFEFRLTFVPGTGTGQLLLFNTADSTTATDSFTSNTVNLSTGCDGIQWGSHNNITFTYYFDDIQVNDTGLPGPAISNTPISVSDAASSAEALTVAVNAPLSDAASTAEVLLANGAVLLGDTASSAEALGISAVAALIDAGSTVENLAITRALALSDAGSSAEALTETAVVPLSDTGSTSEALTANATITLNDAGSGADSLAVDKSFTRRC